MKQDDVQIHEWRLAAFAPAKWLTAVLLSLAFLSVAAPAANAETRTLKLYFIHTKERAEITYKRNGRYLKSGLNKVNRFLRDWRRNEPTNMDPQLLDLLWQVYKSSGARDYIHVVSAYRSPKTNAMLRKRSSGVAKKSQHMLGKAIDFYIPGVKLSKLRNTALKFEAGGVGYYPRSGSPFIHIDVGGVRHWPRMNRKQLLAVFPGGKTIHVPTDGKPLPGYKQALASYEKRKRSGTVLVADDSRKRSGGLLAALFGGGADEEEDNAEVSVASAAPAPKRQVPVAPPPAASAPQPPATPAETPATVLAALSQRDLPIPRAAPRPGTARAAPRPSESLPFEVKPAETAPVAAPAVEAAPPAATVPAEPPLPFQVKPAPEAEQAEMLVAAASVPLPTRRPEITPAMLALASANVEETAPKAPDAAIAEVLADGSTPQAESNPALAAYVPVPAQRPSASAPAAPEEEIRLAALPAPRPAPGTQISSASRDGRVVAAASAGRFETGAAGQREPRIAASQRSALLQNKGTAPEAVLVSGTRVTEKAARPGPADIAKDPTPRVVAAHTVATRRALSQRSMLTEAAANTQPPAFDSEFVRAPDKVYTTGFGQNVTVADATRFTGKAVNFISMAKFRSN